MAKLIKRIVEAQRNNVVISDLNITLKNQGDRVDLLARDSFGRQIRTLQQVTKSKDLDTLLGDNSLFLYDENDNLLSGYTPVKSTSLAVARSSVSTSLKGGTTTYVISDGLRVDPGSVLKLDFDDNGTSTIPSRTDHTHPSTDITDFSEAVDDRLSNLLVDNDYITWTYNDDTGTIVGTTSLGQFTTSNLVEGSNLYYTDERVDDRVSALLTDNSYITWTYDDNAGTIIGTTNLGQFTTSDLTEGSNLYYTQARFDSAFSAKSTTDLSEGSNLYYTQSRFDTAWNAKLSGNAVEYLDGSGNWTSPCLLLTQNFTNQSSVNVTHNFGKNPLVQIIVDNAVFIPLSIVHNTVNDFTVSFSSEKTGKVLAIFGTY